MMINSTLTSLADIVAKSPAWLFNIPIYQRLYVWGDNQVLTLLNDVINAYERGADIYFLGGTLLVEQEAETGRCFDLIDGQQRFTTLWLLCHAWRQQLTPFLTVRVGESAQARLRFAIRPEVNHFLERLALGPNGRLINEVESTQGMRAALALMDSIFEKRPLPKDIHNVEAHMAGLADFIFNKVKFVVTVVPRETDLNKLFEVINNRGVQLQHHEILKARMLDALPEEERDAYAVLWDSCADMDNFVERNLSGISKLYSSEFGLPAHAIAELYEQEKLTDTDVVKSVLQSHIHSQGQRHALSLDDILTNKEGLEGHDDPSASTDIEPTSVRSIFGLPLFLQHVLRIWLHQHKLADVTRLLDGELLDSFDKSFFQIDVDRAANVRTFLNLLWELRVIFDEYLIKWSDQGAEKDVHLISRISVSTNNGKRYLGRASSVDLHRGFSLLQSMLYHSQEITTQYWVTPLLLFIHDHPNVGVEQHFNYLRHLDNHLLGSTFDESLVLRTRKFMDDPWRRCVLIHQEALAEPSGVKFAHYWFYKLEFVLWFKKVRSIDTWSKFRLTAKSSVEHISPQTPTERDGNRVAEALNNFGNLALVSRSINSEYSNLPYNEKRQRFINNNKNRLDSLKMYLIYENETWDDAKAFAHQQAMIAVLDSYYQETPES